MGYGDLKFIFNSSGVETNVSQLEDSAAYFIVHEISIKQA